MMRFGWLFALLFLARPVSAQTQAASTLGAEVRRRVIDSLTAAIEQLYPAADTGRMIAAHVRQRAAAGAYARADDPHLFVRLVTQDLQATNEDTHLVLELAQPSQGGATPLPAHGVERVDRLEGNVGYLRISSFPGGDAAFRAIEQALRVLETTDAILLDLRNSRGGSAQLANFLISHFTGPDTLHSLTIYDRRRNATTERYTMAQVPGPRRPTVPLYVLVDDVTRSAAEDVPFVLQNLKRATIVGTHTAGAGRNNAGVPLGDGFVASVSFTRVMEPGTGREWERTGLTPNVLVAADSALSVAHALALDTLAARATSPARKQELAGAAATVRASLRRPPAAAPPRLLRLVGTYEGGQYVTVSDGQLVYQPRVAQPRVVLVPLDARTFGAGGTRYQFEESGGAMRLRITAADGTTSVYPRVAATVPPRRR